MIHFNEKKLAGLHTASELLDKKYGTEDTNSRKQFNEKARAYYYGEI